MSHRLPQSPRHATLLRRASQSLGSAKPCTTPWLVRAAPDSTFDFLPDNIPRSCCRCLPSSPVYHHHQHTCATHYNPVPTLHHRTIQFFHHLYIYVYVHILIYPLSLAPPVVLNSRPAHVPFPPRPFPSRPAPLRRGCSTFTPRTIPVLYIIYYSPIHPLHSALICAQGLLVLSCPG